MKTIAYMQCALTVLTLAAGGCGSSGSDPATSVNGTSPAASGDSSNPTSFCAKKCIDADQARCLDWASDWSGAFLAAVDACNDNPGCIDAKVAAAPRTERQEKLAGSYCASCGGLEAEACVASFWTAGKPGKNALSYSDRLIDELQNECLVSLEKHAGTALDPALCAVKFSSCPLDHLKSVDPVICRQRR